MVQGNNRILGALDIGTNQIVVLVGELSSRGTLTIIGKGVTTAYGIKKGDIIDYHAASNCVQAALIAAENSAGVALESVYLSQTGAHLQGSYHEGIATISSVDNVVEQDDLDRALHEARSKSLPEDRLYIHHIRTGLFLDGQRVENPVGMQGKRVRAVYWNVSGAADPVRNRVRLVNGLDRQVEDLIVSSVATGNAITTPEERAAGTLVIDIGCGTTDYALYAGGAVQATGVLPVGGDHLTNDLSLGLRISYARANTLKIEHGFVGNIKEEPGEVSSPETPTPAHSDAPIWTVGDGSIGDRSLPKKSIQKILELRLEELFNIVRKELGPLYDKNAVGGGIQLAGGTARVPGIAQLAEKTFGAPARTCAFPDWVGPPLQRPEYATALGLLYCAATDDRQLQHTRQNTGSGFLQRLLGKIQASV